MRGLPVVIALLCAALCVADPAGAATVNRWERTGPEGGPICTVAFAPSNPSIAYAIGRTAPLSDRFGYGLLRSDDGGAHWSLRAAVQGGSDCRLDVSAANPDIVTTETGRTTDGGRTFTFGQPNAYRQTAWTWSGLGPMSLGRGRGYLSSDSYSLDGLSWYPLPTGRTLEVTPNPLDPRNAVAVRMRDASSFEVVVTHDGGRTWVAVERQNPNGISLFGDVRTLDGVFFDPRRNGRAYAGLGRGDVRSHILVSDDGGSTWRELSPTGGWDEIAVVADATAVNLFARDQYGPNPGTWLSRDGGLTWASYDAGPYVSFLSESPAWMRILKGAPDPSRPGRVLYGDASGIWESLDGARTWKLTPNHGIHGHGWELFGSGGHIYAPNRIDTTWQGVLHSSDGGASWTQLAAPNRTVLLATDPNDNRTVLATSDTGLIVSHDAGATWIPLHDPYWTRYPFDAAISGSSITLAGRSWSVSSRNAGASWTERSWESYRWGLTRNASCDGKAKIDPLDHAHLALKPAYPDCVFSWAESHDGGVTWTQHGTPNPWDTPPTPVQPDASGEGASIAFGLTASGSFVPFGEGVATRVVPTLPDPFTGEDWITSVVPISGNRVLAGTGFGLVTLTMTEPVVLNRPTLVHDHGMVRCGFSDVSSVPPVGYRVQIERDGAPTGHDQLHPDTAPAGTYRCHARAVGPFGTISDAFSDSITVTAPPSEEPSETEKPQEDVAAGTDQLHVVGSLRLGTTARCSGAAGAHGRVRWTLKHQRLVVRVAKPTLLIRRPLLGWRLRCSVDRATSAADASAWRTIPTARPKRAR